jgi:exonuclease III
MRLLSWNTAGAFNSPRDSVDRVCAAVRQIEPDVVSLQEVHRRRVDAKPSATSTFGTGCELVPTSGATGGSAGAAGDYVAIASAAAVATELMLQRQHAARPSR